MNVADLPLDETYNAAWAAHYQGRHDEAEQLCRVVLEAAPGQAHALTLMGDICTATGRAQQAQQSYESAVAADPGLALASTRLATLHFRRVHGAPPTPRPLPTDAVRLQMRSLGARGRFGNQLLQYGFAKLYARQYGLTLEAADWIGRDLFDLDDPLPVRPSLPRAEEEGAQLWQAFQGRAVDGVPCNVDLYGYFSGHTSAWRQPGRDVPALFRDLFRPGEKVREPLMRALAQLRSRGRTLVALHIRRGDFGYGDFWLAPASWYRAWLQNLWPMLQRPVLYIATDDPNVLGEFAEYRPLSARDFDASIPGVDYLLDHHVLAQADCLAVANSSFSFTAAMLNERAVVCMRPEPDSARLVSFDPWDAPLLLKAAVTAEQVSEDEQRFLRRLVKPTDHVLHLGRFCAPWTNAVRKHFPDLRVGEIEAHERLDAWRERTGCRHLEHVGVDDAQGLAALVAGGARTLAVARVDCIHARLPAGSRPPAALAALQALGWRLYYVSEAGLHPYADTDALVLPRLFALHERLVPLMFGRQGQEMIDLAAACREHGIAVNGVIHVGAHEGKEVDSYLAMGAQRVLYVEANPAVFERLAASMAQRPQVTVAHRAVSDRAGTLQLHLASFDQSSSILPMQMHRDIYPGVQPAGTVEVPTSPLDALMRELDLPLAGYALLNIDVQGAEALVLRGAAEVLRHVRAVNVEVNFDELYRGGALIEDVEALLGAAGFRRVALTCPYHRTWGDALYVREGHA